MTTINRCHDTHHQVRCSLPAGHSSDCRFPSTPTGEIEIAIDVMHGASRVYWATPGVQNVLDTATLALQAALDENQKLQDENHDLHWLTTRHAEILTGTVNALRGDPGPLTTWSHHDAAELAVAIVAERDQLRAELAAMETERDDAIRAVGEAGAGEL